MQWYCEKCKTPNSDEMDFCGICGEPRPEKLSQYCSECGNPTTDGESICDRCKKLQHCSECGVAILTGETICEHCKSIKLKKKQSLTIAAVAVAAAAILLVLFFRKDALFHRTSVQETQETEAIVVTSAPTLGPTKAPTATPALTQTPMQTPVDHKMLRYADAVPEDYVEEFMLKGYYTYYNYGDLDEFSQSELRLILNGLYAMSGKEFSPEVADYFYRKSWYEPVSGDAKKLEYNAYQLANIDLIAHYEADHGYR